MTVQTLYTAASGMEALQTKLDVIANNLANINTVGFKTDRVNFEDLFYLNEALPGTIDPSGNPSPTGTYIGLGSKVSSVQTVHQQGPLQQTNRELDIAIEGRGFMVVDDPATGEQLYTRAGNLNINANGDLVLGSASTGRPLPGINIPQDATDIAIQPDGTVQYRQPGNSQLADAGQIQMVTFQNPDGLMKLGENLYAETDASSTATVGQAGQDGLGVFRQRFLEASNVEPVRELIDLITTQRAFELNSQAIEAGDEILQQVANLSRL